ncbi:hypothetical protein BDV93DRAFT_494638 [Ceratobasidium sp. AG-I]|nr:hypothetical protein BDV93DRAFT_494638 [Ceratobasidium sp. AG-I]
MVQGWSSEHMVLPEGSRAHAQWTMYYHAPSTLNVWRIPCLALNRILMKNVRGRRWEPRWARLEVLWDTVKANAVQPARTESTPRTLATAVSEASRIKPIPEFSDALEWPVIKELLNTYRPVSEMEARFVQERLTIDREVSAWCARIKTSLLDAVRKSLNLHRCMPYAPISGTTPNHHSNNPLRDLPFEMQLLFRADTIFAPYTSGSQDSPSLRFCGYETYMRDLRHWVGYKESEHWRLVSDGRFTLHSTAPDIARALLGALGRPLGTTILELEALDERFVCGRCNDRKPKTWLEMIKYYLDRQEEWRHIAEHIDWFTKNNVAARNVHNLKSDSPKPLIRLLSPKELHREPSASDSDARSDGLDTLDYVLLCGPCLRASNHAKPMSRLQVMHHLCEMHEISEPQLGNPEVDLLKLEKRNYDVIPADSLEKDGRFLHDDDDGDDRLWELGSQEGSDDEDWFLHI